MDNIIYHLNLRKQLHLEAVDALDFAITLAKQVAEKDSKIKELQEKIKELQGGKNEI